MIDSLPVSRVVYNPTSVAVDAAGNLYVVDYDESGLDQSVIWKVDAATGGITQKATGGYAVAVDAAAGDLFVVDADAERVFKVDAVSGVNTTVAGNLNVVPLGDGGSALDAALNYPHGVALDAAGNLYIADSYNSRIRKVSAGGMVAFSSPDPRVLVLSNTGNESLSISGITVSAGFAVDAATSTCSLSTPLAAGDSCVIGVDHTGGELTGTLTISDDALNGSGATQQAQLSMAVATPAISPISYCSCEVWNAPLTITLSDATPGATIYYTTDGSAPTTASTPYTKPLTISATTTVQAIAVAGGYPQSAVASGRYTLITAPPTFSPGPGGYYSTQTVTLSDAAAGAVIYYTLDGSTPTTASTPYTGPITLSTSMVIKAIAVSSSSGTSAVAIGSYWLEIPGPSFSQGQGTYTAPLTVALSDDLAGATIYYTLDGSTPTTASTLYTGPIPVNTTTTINAIAVVSGLPPLGGWSYLYLGNGPTQLLSWGGHLRYRADDYAFGCHPGGGDLLHAGWQHSDHGFHAVYGADYGKHHHYDLCHCHWQRPSRQRCFGRNLCDDKFPGGVSHPLARAGNL